MHRCTHRQLHAHTDPHTLHMCTHLCPHSCTHVHTQAPPPELHSPRPAQPHPETQEPRSSPSAGGKVNTGSSGIKADPATLQSQEDRVGRCRKKQGPREDEDRRDTDAAVRAACTGAVRAVSVILTPRPTHTDVCTRKPNLPCRDSQSRQRGEGPRQLGILVLAPHGSQAYMHGLPHPASPSGCSLGPVSLQGQPLRVEGLEGPRPHFPWGKHIYPGNGKNNQCSV